MSLGGHIDELRIRLLRCVSIIAVFWIIGWFLQKPVYDALNDLVLKALDSYRQQNPNFKYAEPFTNMSDAFMLQFRLSFMLGLGMALPIVVNQVWGFVRPGLKPTEAKPIARLIPLSVLLFALGVTCCWLILPITFEWFLSFFSNFQGASLNQQPGTMVFFILKMLFAFGIGFQLPLLVYIAGRLGLISSETLTHYWRHVAVFVFVASALITPSGDIISMLMMAIPLTLLMVASIVAVRLTMRKDGGPRPEELNDLD